MPKIHRSGKRKKEVPVTTRWCFACQTETIWILNKKLGHSRCSECGGIYSAENEVPEEAITVAAKRLMPWIMGSD